MCTPSDSLSEIVEYAISVRMYAPCRALHGSYKLQYNKPRPGIQGKSYNNNRVYESELLGYSYS